jgi:hypothetical protein
MVNFTLRLLYPCEIIPVPNEYLAGWVPGLVWTFWRNDKSLAHTGIWTLDHPTRSLVTIPNMLLWHLGIFPELLDCTVTQEISILLIHSLLAKSEVNEFHIQLLKVEKWTQMYQVPSSIKKYAKRNLTVNTLTSGSLCTLPVNFFFKYLKFSWLLSTPLKWNIYKQMDHNLRNIDMSLQSVFCTQHLMKESMLQTTFLQHMQR